MSLTKPKVNGEMVAEEGFEPPTRGFSIRCSNQLYLFGFPQIYCPILPPWSLLCRLRMLKWQLFVSVMASGKWQAIVRHKSIGTTSRSFHMKQAAINWVISIEEQLEAGTFGTIRPAHFTLGELLERYSGEVTPKTWCEN